ncbi:MAG TPA: hypothetical protein PKA48_09910, partial [Candidatus Obscuribacter sp.]|nr:hypothetical protein [Candidatus Obscuribacter sp.]
ASFVSGIISCNLIFALASGLGLTSLGKLKSVLVMVSIFTAVFSFLVGISFLSGMGDSLPDLQKLLP